MSIKIGKFLPEKKEPEWFIANYLDVKPFVCDADEASKVEIGLSKEKLLEVILEWNKDHAGFVGSLVDAIIASTSELIVRKDN